MCLHVLPCIKSEFDGVQNRMDETNTEPSRYTAFQWYMWPQILCSLKMLSLSNKYVFTKKNSVNVNWGNAGGVKGRTSGVCRDAQDRLDPAEIWFPCIHKNKSNLLRTKLIHDCHVYMKCLPHTVSDYVIYFDNLKKCTLSYNHHRTGCMNHYCLFMVRPWNDEIYHVWLNVFRFNGFGYMKYNPHVRAPSTSNYEQTLRG